MNLSTILDDMPNPNSGKLLAGLLLSSALALLSLPTEAQATGRPIKNIYACAPSEIVVEFEESSGMPNVPHILDLPGPNHRVVLDFSDASFEEGVVADPEAISVAVNRILPNIKAVHYSNISNGGRSVARLVLDLDPAASVSPNVTELALGQVTVSLADKRASLPQQGQWQAQAPAQGQWQAQRYNMNDANVATAATAPPMGGGGFASAASQAMNTDDRSMPGSSTPGSWNRAAATNTAAESRANVPSQTPAVSAAPAPSSSDPGERALEALKHYNNAVKLHLVGKLNDAITEYQNALALNPQLSEAHSNLGLVYNQQHNYAQALSEFRKALSINPRDAITYNGIGAALRAEKDLPGAIKNWESAVELDPHLATASYNLGTAYELEKEYDRAVKAYQQAVRNDYRLGEAYYRVGLIMERQHRFQDATQQFEQALKVSGNSEYSEDARQRLAYLEQNKKISKR
jgi:tetratricopeptide (TPR) repeat protein